MKLIQVSYHCEALQHIAYHNNNMQSSCTDARTMDIVKLG